MGKGGRQNIYLLAHFFLIITPQTSYQIIYSPFDVVKTRRQMVGNAEAINSCDHLGLKEYSFWQQNKSVGTFGHMQQIVKQEGISGLWEGNLTRMVKVAPA